MRRVSTLWAGLALAVCAACGGGGGDGGNGSVVVPPPPPPPPPPANRAPVVAQAIPNQRPVDEHAFSFDVSQGGTTFVDPDGDPFTIAVHFVSPAPPGLAIAGANIQGVPTQPGVYEVFAQAYDGLDHSNGVQFFLAVVANANPGLDQANVGYVVPVGSPVDIDATRGGAAFTDIDGDSLSYSAEFVSPPRGLAIQGTRITGSLGAVGTVRVRLTARDAYGGVGFEEFPVAAPAAETRVPRMPGQPFVYDDAELDLPYIFRISSTGVIPLWDTQPDDNRTGNAGAALGRVLFYDRRLSITNTVSCGSCHEQSAGFTVSERFGTGTLEMPTTRNPMSLGNARYNLRDSFFFDHRVQTLETLALMPIENPIELGTPLPMVTQELETAGFYASLFEAAFGTPEITLDRVARALSQFVRSLISYRSRFDEAHHGMTNEQLDPSLVLTPQELRGKEVFGDFGRGGCFICHTHEIQTMFDPSNNGLDAAFTDPGAGVGSFRPPSLRNIAVTGPYMHDGRFATLREVIEHYDQGVQENPNLDPLLREGLIGPPRRLNLSEEDKVALEIFLNTLTDEEFLADPKFADPFE